MLAILAQYKTHYIKWLHGIGSYNENIQEDFKFHDRDVRLCRFDLDANNDSHWSQSSDESAMK